MSGKPEITKNNTGLNRTNRQEEQTFQVESDFEPEGDQPHAIEKLSEGLRKGYDDQTLLGVTGSGKTFTMAKIIEEVQRPALVMSHNKTLAAQLFNEFRDFFPNNAVEYFVSFYDYYQPEAYVPQSDTYIEKDSSINDEIDKLRLSATTSLLRRRDVIVVASVSAIYGLGSPDTYQKMVVPLEPGREISRRDLLSRFVTLQYERNDMNFKQGTFRVRGDIVEIFPAYWDSAVRIEMFGDEIESLVEFNPMTGEILGDCEEVILYPATHFVMSKDQKERAIDSIKTELNEWEQELKDRGKDLEAERIRSRTEYDIEILEEVGYVNGIENYSRHLDGRSPGEPPYTLLDYFPDDFITFIDESHQSIPQIGGMIHGDRSRKDKLVDHGFRLPSAYDNRPLTFEEFRDKTEQTIFVSATPGDFEREESEQIVEQIVRPTGLVDPPIEVKPTENQVDDLIEEIQVEVENDNRVLVTTLTKRLAENLTDYLVTMGLQVQYLHSEIDTLERTKILRNLRRGEFDVLVGINLLREGLDLPEVSLVAIMDADRKGFLRSPTTLIQMIGRSARNVEGRVVMYGDEVTPAMEQAISETERRREIQMEFNEKHDIEPTTIEKEISDHLPIGDEAQDEVEELVEESQSEDELLEELWEKMETAADNLNFEKAAKLRDKIEEINDDPFDE
ncbi:MAG: excinuclease ABC subunit UvrB [bacterium]